MKTTKTLLMLLAVSLSFTACNKDDDNDSGDLTTGIVGHYVNAADNTDITVNKIDDTHVSIQFSTGNGSTNYSSAFANVLMNSATSFTLGTATGTDGCGRILTGTGTYSNNNISMFLTKDDPTNGVGSCGDTTESISATRQ